MIVEEGCLFILGCSFVFRFDTDRASHPFSQVGERMSILFLRNFRFLASWFHDVAVPNVSLSALRAGIADPGYNGVLNEQKTAQITK
jgi:hypothetical protein